MKTSLLIGLVFLFIVLTILSGIVEGTYLGGTETTRLEKLFQPDFPAVSNFVEGVAAFLQVSWEYIANLWCIFWFQYAFFVGAWVIVQFLFMCVPAGIIATVILNKISG